MSTAELNPSVIKWCLIFIAMNEMTTSPATIANLNTEHYVLDSTQTLLWMNHLQGLRPSCSSVKKCCKKLQNIVSWRLLKAPYTFSKTQQGIYTQKTACINTKVHNNVRFRSAIIDYITNLHVCSNQQVIESKAHMELTNATAETIWKLSSKTSFQAATDSVLCRSTSNQHVRLPPQQPEAAEEFC